MSNNQLNDAMNLVNDLSVNMDKLMKVQTDIMKKLPPELQPQLASIKRDMNAVKKAIKNGDLDMLNELTKRYADSVNTK